MGERAKASVLLLRNVPEERSFSMERYGDELEEAFAGHPRFEVTSMTLRAPAKTRRASVAGAHSYLVRFAGYPVAAARRTADVYHVPDHGYAHLAALLPRERTVVTCHDVMLLLAEEGHEGIAGERGRALSVARFRWSTSYLKKVARVMCVSRATAGDVARLCDVPRDRITVVPNGVNRRFQPLPDDLRARLKRELPHARRHAVLHVSSDVPYKNVAITLRVLAALRDAGTDVTLVRVGDPLNPAERALAEELRLDGAVVECGRVGDARLVELYNACDALLFPSQYEGFGWPPLEAMACGTPVVTSDAPALLEVVADAALVAAPRDVPALTASVRSVLESPDVAADLRARGLERAARFGWDRTAAGIAAVYEDVLAAAARARPGAVPRRSVAWAAARGARDGGARAEAAMANVTTGKHGQKRRDADSLEAVQAGNREWWESTPMTYDWRGETPVQELTPEWFDDQDRRSAEVHAHFATDRIPFDRLIPYDALRGKEVLEIGVGSGFHAELLASAGAAVTGIDLTQAAVERTRRRFELKGLEGSFEQWDAEELRPDFERRFDFVWSWGVIHHSSRTARIVRNVEQWLVDDGSFAGMVYHRDSTSAAAALILHGLLRGKLRSQSVDETLWRNTDGYTARLYPADQWRDLLLAFFAEASVRVTGNEPDALPLPRALRKRLSGRISPARRDRILARAGSFLTFHASHPLRA